MLHNHEVVVVVLGHIHWAHGSSRAHTDHVVKVVLYNVVVDKLGHLRNVARVLRFPVEVVKKPLIGRVELITA